MQMRFWILWMLAALLALTGCSREESTDESMHESATNGSRVPDDTVFSDQVKALEKAEAVGQTLDDAVAKQRETLELQK
jgi:hypothetical protein